MMTFRFLGATGFSAVRSIMVWVLALAVCASGALAQQPEDAVDEPGSGIEEPTGETGDTFRVTDDGIGETEEIVVVGSQIKGANIRDALAVSVVTAAEIEELGVDSGDDLLAFMAEQGQNFFVQSESYSGGVNSARGDVGAFNLRNLGTGNTLVLLNGRRLVNMASYQTELVGGSFVPVNTVNSNVLPVFGLERIEILRDGASAIYGADAVAGVVNYVTKTDFDGLSVRARYATWEGLPRDDASFSLEWGKNFNNGRTNLSVFASYYDRDPVNSQDDPKWADDDYRRYIPEGSPFFGNSAFYRASANSQYGQYDVVRNVGGFSDPFNFFDSSGEFNTYPLGNEYCQFTDPQYPNVCFAADGNPIYRFNNNTNRDLVSDLQRTNVFVFLNHEFENGIQSFTEFTAYLSDTRMIREGSTPLSSVADFTIAANAYWNPLGAVGTTARLPDSIIGPDIPAQGLELSLDNYRWVEAPRTIDNSGETYRFMTGLRGQMGQWDWETALVWSRDEKKDLEHDRISNTLMQEALNDPTPNGYNLFSAGTDTNIERTLVDVYRNGKTELKLIDFKLSKADLFDTWEGPVGFLAGAEWRQESFEDDRDPRLDGTIPFTDNSGATFPLVADVMANSPTADSRGSRDVLSAFAEFQIPLHETLDAQLAVRYEDFSDINDSTMVGKIAMGWRPFEPLLFRGSWSEAYRVPNLVTVNETGVARTNTQDDRVCFFVDPNETLLDCRYGMQRYAGGSDQLVPEESVNTSIGVVWDATDNLSFTVDWWSIDKKKTIGLFGEENHTALDLLRLIEAGTGNCASNPGNPAVVRAPNGAAPGSPEEALFLAAGICPVGQVQLIDDTYRNLDTRDLSGVDIGVYFDIATAAGDFDFRYVASHLKKFFQSPGPNARELLDAQESGTLPPGLPIVGFSDQIRQDGNPEWKHTIHLSWRKGAWGASLSGARISDVIETRPGLGTDGSPWVLDSMTTFNGSVDYRFRMYNNTETRLRLGVVNLTDERAPLASERFGFESDVHNDLPRSWYAEVMVDF